MHKQLITHAFEEFRNTDMSIRQLHKFGYLVGGICVAIGGYFFWRDSAYVLLTLGVVLLVGGLVYPQALRIPYRLWMGLAVVLGFFVGNGILILLYYLVITPIGLMRRVTGSDPLERAFNASALSYWKPHTERRGDHMKRPF